MHLIELSEDEIESIIAMSNDYINDMGCCVEYPEEVEKLERLVESLKKQLKQKSGA